MDLSATDIMRLLEKRHADDVFVPECKNGPTHTASHVRMDAWAMTKSWQNANAIGYEVKVSRGDFLQDNKWPAYLPLCNQLFFVCPTGLIDPSELHEDVGLLWASKTGGKLYTKKKAKYREVTIPESVFRYVLMCRVRVTRENFVPDSKRDFWEGWLEEKQLDHEFGRNVSYALTQRIKSEITRVDEENKQLRDKMAGFEDIRKLLTALGINPESRYAASKYEVERKLNEARKALPAGLLRDLGNLSDSLTRMKEKLAQIETPDTEKAFDIAANG